MKKYLLTIAFVAAQISAVAQTVNVHFKNGQQIQYPASEVDYVDFSAGQVVDLGLSVYWASFNLGAEKPEEYGDYYAWGETKPKSSYYTSTYSHYDKEKGQIVSIGENISGTGYDAATTNLGSDWRMPTKEEFAELKEKCTWEWIVISGIRGYKITGINGNSIFLPAAGRKSGTITLDENSFLWYLSATQASSLSYCYLLACTSDDVTIMNDSKTGGYVIRPVTKNINASVNITDHSQDHLVTDKVSASFIGGAYNSINGVIQSGSVLNTQFTNGSSESVTLVAIQIFDSGSSNVGNNVLESEVEVAAGESKSYGLKLGTNMTTPVVRFTYRYNKKNYTAEATWTTPSSPF